MSEKLTLARYLKGRGEVKALTHIEALAFGVPYPLQPGWPSRYGAVEITGGMIEDLKIRMVTAKNSTASRARRGLEGIGDAVPVSDADLYTLRQRSLAGNQPAHALLPRSRLFPGFVLRQARRYQLRDSGSKS